MDSHFKEFCFLYCGHCLFSYSFQLLIRNVFFEDNYFSNLILVTIHYYFL